MAGQDLIDLVPVFSQWINSGRTSEQMLQFVSVASVFSRSKVLKGMMAVVKRQNKHILIYFIDLLIIILACINGNVFVIV